METASGGAEKNKQGHEKNGRADSSVLFVIGIVFFISIRHRSSIKSPLLADSYLLFFSSAVAREALNGDEQLPKPPSAALSFSLVTLRRS